MSLPAALQRQLRSSTLSAARPGVSESSGAWTGPATLAASKFESEADVTRTAQPPAGSRTATLAASAVDAPMGRGPTAALALRKADHQGESCCSSKKFKTRLIRERKDTVKRRPCVACPAAGHGGGDGRTTSAAASRMPFGNGRRLGALHRTAGHPTAQQAAGRACSISVDLREDQGYFNTRKK